MRMRMKMTMMERLTSSISSTTILLPPPLTLHLRVENETMEMEMVKGIMRDDVPSHEDVSYPITVFPKTMPPLCTFPLRNGVQKYYAPMNVNDELPPSN